MKVNKTITLLTTSLTSFLTPFMASSINIALPSIAEEFKADAITLAWIPTIYLLAAAVFLVPFGKLADIYGRKKIFLSGIIVYTISSFLCAIANSSMALLFFRVIQGFGGAMIFGTGVALLTSIFPQNERGKVLGINTASVYSGASFGPLIGGFLTQHLTWRSIFFLNAILGIIVIFFVLVFLRGEWKFSTGDKFDLAGATVYSISLVLLLYGIADLPGTAAILFIACGLFGTLLFVLHELRTECPIINVKLFKRNSVFAFSNLAALINYAATAGVGFLMSLYLQYVKGISPQNAGVILVSQAVVMACVAPVAGRLSDRVEPRIISSAGMFLTFLALVCLAFVSDGINLGIIVIILVLLGAGLGLFSSPNTNAVMSSVDKRYYGVASATLATMRIIGQMSSLAIAMLFISLFIGNVQITGAVIPQLVSTMHAVFAVFAALCFFGIFASLRRGNVHANHELQKT
jgi:EmrB/QacA subfamily drug resistance transporter